MGVDAVALNTNTVASGASSLAIGIGNVASGEASFAQGWCTVASGLASHAEGGETMVSGTGSHAEGRLTRADSDHSHAEGWGTITGGIASHAEGQETMAAGAASHAEGYYTNADGDYSHAEGEGTRASGRYAHAEGGSTMASGDYSHAEGLTSRASGHYSHAEGYGTKAENSYSHAEGGGTTASGFGSHAEGGATTASGTYSHAEGGYARASGEGSHAEGLETIASGRYSHAGGNGTIAQNDYQTVIGKYNIATSSSLNNTQNDDAFIIGRGVETARSNAFRVVYTGNVYAAGTVNPGGADYAEMFEWLDGNPHNEDRCGVFVTPEDAYIRIATSADTYILGVVSGVPSVVGDSHGTGWHGMFLRDRFGRLIYDWVDVEQGAPCCEEAEMTRKTEIIPMQHPKLNPAYDPEKTYIPRNERKEWATVGIIGKLAVRDDGSCLPSGYCRPNAQGIATACDQGYRVLQRIDADTVLIVFR